jgi:hypothetical protein
MPESVLMRSKTVREWLVRASNNVGSTPMTFSRRLVINLAS